MSKREFSFSENFTMIFVLYISSLVISLVYLCCRVDRKKTSCIIFALSIIYASLFVFLNIIAAFDLLFSKQEEFGKVLEFVKKFYFAFNIVDKALGFVLFNILIFYLESGHYSIIKKLLDYLIRNWNALKKMTCCGIFGIVIIGVPIVSVLLTFLIKNREIYGLESPLDYIGVILDCYSVFEIYSSVGFFIVQLIIDYRQKKNDKLIQRYYRYSITKIIDKTESYIKKINHTYEVLNKAAPNFDNKNFSYNSYLQGQLAKIKEKINSYELEGNNVYVNNYIYNNVRVYNNITTDMNINNINNTNNDKNSGRELKNKSGEEGDKKEKEKDEDFPTCIRKYKKAVRRIDKLKKLYNEIEQDANKPRNGNCTRRFVILFIALFIAVTTDFLLPISMGNDHDYYHDSEDTENFAEEKDTVGLILAMLLIVVVSVICCSYTIIIVYSTNRMRYITGDFLYDRQINDNISLMKTVQIVCGYSFALVYCNLYFWRAIDKNGALGKPNFYDECIIPDYNLKQGISIYMIIKIVVIVVSMIGCLLFSSKFVFKNDLAEYNLSCDGCKYDDEVQFKRFLEEKCKIYNILKH